MVQRTQNFYPQEPKYEDFCKKFNHLNTYHTGGSGAGTTSQPAPTWVSPAIDEAGYQAYLTAMRLWRSEVLEVDKWQHRVKLEKQAYAKKVAKTPQFLETALGPAKGSLYELAADVWKPIYVDLSATDPKGTRQVYVSYKARAEKSSTPSEKPEKVAKRAARKALEKAKVEASTKSLISDASLLKSCHGLKVDVKKQVKELKIRSVLFAEETKAARSAAERAKSIRFGSIDETTNIVPGEWKVVTRKKGSVPISTGQTTSTVQGDGSITVASTRDISVPCAVPHLAGVRKPTVSRS